MDGLVLRILAPGEGLRAFPVPILAPGEASAMSWSLTAGELEDDFRGPDQTELVSRNAFDGGRVVA